MLLVLKIKMYDRYMMYTKASEASTAFSELRSYLFSVVNRGGDEGRRFCLKSLYKIEKNSKIARVTPMALSIVTRSSSMRSW